MTRLRRAVAAGEPGARRRHRFLHRGLEFGLPFAPLPAVIAQSFVGAGSWWKISEPTIGLGYSYVNGPPVTAKSFYYDNVVLDWR